MTALDPQIEDAREVNASIGKLTDHDLQLVKGERRFIRYLSMGIFCLLVWAGISKFDKATVAGCYVLDGKLSRNSKIRIIRDGIVEFPRGEGQAAELGSLKRFKDDVKEVVSNMECGLTIKNFADLKPGDIVEAFEEEEVKRTL